MTPRGRANHQGGAGQYGSVVGGRDVETGNNGGNGNGGGTPGTPDTPGGHVTVETSPLRQQISELGNSTNRSRNSDFGGGMGGGINKTESVDVLEGCATLEEIDAAIDCIEPLSSDGARVIRRYHPQPFWLWTQWYGTIFQHGLKKVVLYMIFTAVVCAVADHYDNPKDPDDPVDNSLAAFNQMWKYILTFTTFIMTFFLNQSYNLWRQVYNLSRSVQGRTNDFGLLLATHAARDPDGQYTPQARKLLEDVAMAVRIFHAFVYATKTRAYRVLHTDRALRRMVERNIMSHEMMDALKRLDISHANRVYALIEWIVVQFRVGLEEGSLKGGPGFEEMYLEKALMLRSQYGTFGDVLDARIPLAYGYFVQVMADVLLFCAPFACYKDMGYFAVGAVGVLSLFFAGLLDLAKVMLDPLDNEDYCDGVIDINVGVFIRESNSGSVRFYKGAEHLPKSWLK